MRLFVTGGTGLVGQQVAARLRERGDEVLVLSRSAKAAEKLPAGAQVISGNPTVPGAWLDDLATCDGVIHLAGESIAGHRWSSEFKKKVLDSRAVSTRLIAERMAQTPEKTRVLVNASAVGYYGMFGDNPTEFIESDLPGSGFLADVCVAWETATEPAAAAGVRVAIIRVGLVLAKQGGPLKQIARPFRFFMGGQIASGRQWVSWIHINDLAKLFIFALDREEARGPINGTSPYPVTNWGFSKAIASTLHRPCWLRAPKLALKILMGEMSELATLGQRAMPKRASQLGFDYRYPMLDDALKEALLGQ